MGPVLRSTPTTAAAARLAAMLVALAGLFAMHGLTDHATAHPAVHGSVTSLSMSDTGAHAEAAMASVGPGAAWFAKDAGPLEGSAVLGLCLAVLGLAGLAASVLAARGRRTGWRSPRTVRALMTGHRAVRIRAPDPPAHLLWQVSRC